VDKIDYLKSEKALYAPSSKEPVIVTVPEMNFIMVDGKGNPNNSVEYQNAVEALFSVAYTLKFMPRKGVSIPGFTDYKVCPLEGLWWSDNYDDFVTDNKDNWNWTMMIRVPEFITDNFVLQAIELAKKKKENDALNLVRFEKYNEGICTQLMHIGPYSAEHENIMKIHEFALNEGYKLHGKHHEIYLGDPRKTKPEKLKTVLRQPVIVEELSCL
jgi:hypothetical protein